MQFDQIAFNIRNITKTFLGIDMQNTTVKMGVVNFYESVFKNTDADYYQPTALKLKPNRKFGKTWFDTWKTFQMSDHLPFWIELRIDFTDEFLGKMRDAIAKEETSDLIPTMLEEKS